ncbi:hypothetical protein CYLTODRAFT_487304 [Cylindrobasidium torrendii FP15055 ss-10]|uniref:F-box domain-containing protein n=1 Tax=Cylindrobasidium torrendii FP15055 ss-10 TaxID=1314674 RepID=A0A0D7BMK1_9AGAR|nr:hypothetical protein CYLTODRAFT_487304 [Cylindrobasidium torrendii FP15055 ss-10]
MPPKKTKFAKSSKDTAQADAVIGHTVRKRKRVDKSDLVPCHQDDSAKRQKLEVEEDTFFRILDVPTDILYEICSHLHPLGLLHLSRTCKSLRATLMSVASRHAWRSSFESIMFDGIRDVRDDLCEPRLATMLFEKRCDGCQKPRRSNPQFMLRVNMCQSCLWRSPEFMRYYEFRRAAETVAPKYCLARRSIEHMIPYGSSAQDNHRSRVYDRASFLEMIQETKDLTDDEFATWCKAEAANFKLLREECKYLGEFKDLMDKEASYEEACRIAASRAAICNQRQNDIAARFLNAGYVTTSPGGDVGESFWADMSRLHWRDPKYECWRMASREVPLTDKEWALGGILRNLIDCGVIIEGEKLRKKKERARERARERRAAKRRANE